MTDAGDLTAVRRNYQSQSIGVDDLMADPIAQFGAWMNQAREQQITDATAMTLATSTPNGVPSLRIVLLKYFDDNGFCWYTDGGSQKGRELTENPVAGLLFYWREFNRQVRIQGVVEKLSLAAADTYFNQRPEGSRFSAAASQQSAAIESRTSLEVKIRDLRARFPHGDVPRPERWIGYLLRPDYFEFWQGSGSRLHDRIAYKPGNEGWNKSRLSP